jgi:hypothetical protein
MRIAFFFTMPIRGVPMSAMTEVVAGQQRQERPDPADGSVERIVIGWIRLS